MADSPKLINIDLDLTKPVTTLIEKVSDAVGVLYEPRRIVNKAKANAEAEKISAVANLEASSVEQRAIKRMVNEEVKKQLNMERVLDRALPYLAQDATPQRIEDDWLSNLFQHARYTSDEEMQDAWGRILAGEANKPGSYTKRTVNLMAELERSDALKFSKLVSYCWNLDGQIPIVFDLKNEVYTKNGIDFDTLNHLSSLGLVTFEPLAGYVKHQEGTGSTYESEYQGTRYALKVTDGADNRIQVGLVLLTQQGHELAGICSKERIEGFEEYIINKFKADGLLVTKSEI